MRRVPLFSALISPPLFKNILTCAATVGRMAQWKGNLVKLSKSLTARRSPRNAARHTDRGKTLSEGELACSKTVSRRPKVDGALDGSTTGDGCATMDGGAIALMSEPERAFDDLAEYPGVIVSRSQSDCNACRLY